MEEEVASEVGLADTLPLRIPLNWRVRGAFRHCQESY
jgi:hypothetical protein